MKTPLASAIALCVTLSAFSQTNLTTKTAAPAAPLIGLKDAFAGKFLVGTAGDVPSSYSETELANIKANYNIITPENCMKPQSVHPTEDNFTWSRADALVKWCADNNIKVWGHTLAWHAQSGRWFYAASTNEQVSTRDASLARLKSHIEAEAGRYKGKVYGWDVVNEAIDDRPVKGDPEQIRRDAWDVAVGPDFINFAFKYAHEADPNALLFYNDYNIEQGAVNNTGKHAASMALLKRLIKEGVPINGVGIQGHWHLDTNLKDVEKAIEDYESLGLKIGVSELDVTATGGNSGAFGNFGGGQPVTAEALQKQAQVYAQLFDIFNRHAKSISRITFWGISDNRSWRRGQAALVFDGKLQPKPALFSILDVAQGRYTPPQ